MLLPEIPKKKNVLRPLNISRHLEISSQKNTAPLVMIEYIEEKIVNKQKK